MAADAVNLARNGVAPVEPKTVWLTNRQSRADASPFAVLQEHDGNQRQRNDHMDDNNDGMHINFII